MSGFFGCVSRRDCVADVFYGTDYHSHLGTKRAGLAFYNGTEFNRSIHSLESAYFRNKFEPELDRFAGSNLGVGVISDMESQPITVTSHLGRFAVVVVGRLANLDEIVDEFLKERKHFAELSSSTVNQTAFERSGEKGWCHGIFLCWRLKRSLYPGQRRPGYDQCGRSRCTDTGKTGSNDLCMLRRS